MAHRKISRFIPRDQKWLIACLIAVSSVDSVLVGYDSSLMGSLNVMPSYSSYFTLTTTTKSLNTAISYVGGAAISPLAGFLADWRGRRECVFWSALVTLIGGVIQGTAQNIGMFIAGRCIVGEGMGLAQTTAPTLVAETTPGKYRGFALGMYYACWGIGTLIAAGVCFGAAPSRVCFLILLSVPESPRWLISHDRHEEVLEVLSIVNGGDADDGQVQYREIADTISFEKEHSLGLVQAICKKSNRKRLLITTTFSAIAMLPGTNIITFYFGEMLQNAGIQNPNTQLQINVILTSWSLVIAVVSAWYTDFLGRGQLCSASLALQTAFIFIFGAFTKLYGESTNTSGIYATIAIIFLYNGAYSWGITPLTVLYPPEILSFEIRGVGMGIYTFATKCCGLLVTMAVPFGLQAIGWKFYMVNGCLILEEVDELFDKEKREVVAVQVHAETKVDIQHNEC
ncbi:general substrate transporter [Trichoderma compactum]